MGLITAGRGALADRAAFQRDDPSVEAGPIGVDPGWPSGGGGRPEPVPSVVLCSGTAPSSWRDRSFQPITARSMQAKSQGGPPPGPSWGRETAVNNGQPRCPTDNQPPSLSAVIGRDGAAGPYMACKGSGVQIPSAPPQDEPSSAPSASDSTNPSRTAVARSASAIVTCSAKTNRSTCGAIPQVPATFARRVIRFLAQIRW
jgi:hypothetical protein